MKIHLIAKISIEREDLDKAVLAAYEQAENTPYDTGTNYWRSAFVDSLLDDLENKVSSIALEEIK